MNEPRSFSVRFRSAFPLDTGDHPVASCRFALLYQYDHRFLLSLLAYLWRDNIKAPVRPTNVSVVGTKGENLRRILDVGADNHAETSHVTVVD
jgi:hypothetical protein